ncbi:MAG: MarR family winged helix-turn-helix transcriptional regulator [Phycisphaerae bacterium]
MSPSLEPQAERLYQLFAELVRRYQFRDRDRICCHGLSVSQCYTLDALDRLGPRTMGELAGHLCLEISTMTRVVDHLVANKLAARVADANDRRVCRVRITGKGRALVSKVHDGLIAEYEQVLRAVPPESREAVIQAVSQLLSAFEERQRCSSADAKGGRRRARRTG